MKSKAPGSSFQTARALFRSYFSFIYLRGCTVFLSFGILLLAKKKNLYRFSVYGGGTRI